MDVNTVIGYRESANSMPPFTFFFYGRKPEAMLYKTDTISTKMYLLADPREETIYHYHEKEVEYNNVAEFFRISKAGFIELLVSEHSQLFQAYEFCKEKKSAIIEIEITKYWQKVRVNMDCSSERSLIPENIYTGYHVFIKVNKEHGENVWRSLVDRQMHEDLNNVKWLENYGNQKEGTLEDLIARINELENGKEIGVTYKVECYKNTIEDQIKKLDFILDIRKSYGYQKNKKIHDEQDDMKGLIGKIDVTYNQLNPKNDLQKEDEVSELLSAIRSKWTKVMHDSRSLDNKESKNIDTQLNRKRKPSHNISKSYRDDVSERSMVNSAHTNIPAIEHELSGTSDFCSICKSQMICLKCSRRRSCSTDSARERIQYQRSQEENVKESKTLIPLSQKNNSIVENQSDKDTKEKTDQESSATKAGEEKLSVDNQEFTSNKSSTNNSNIEKEQPENKNLQIELNSSHSSQDNNQSSRQAIDSSNHTQQKILPEYSETKPNSDDDSNLPTSQTTTTHESQPSKNKSYEEVKSKSFSLPLPEPQEFTVIFLGESGVGKSTLISGLANYLNWPTFTEAKTNEMQVCIPLQFKVQRKGEDNKIIETIVTAGNSEENENFNDIGQSATQKPKIHYFTFQGNMVKVIDTPGLSDSRGVEQDKENLRLIRECIHNQKEIHAICIVLKSHDRIFRPEFELAVRKFLSLFPKLALKNLFFFFTHANGNVFGIGDSTGPVKEMQKKIQDSHEETYSFEGENTCAVDSESFKFLLCEERGVKYSNRPKEDFDFCWNESAAQVKNFLTFVRTVKPVEREVIIAVHDLATTALNLEKFIRTNDQLTPKSRQNLESESKVILCAAKKYSMVTKYHRLITDIEEWEMDEFRRACENCGKIFKDVQSNFSEDVFRRAEEAANLLKPRNESNT